MSFVDTICDTEFQTLETAFEALQEILYQQSLVYFSKYIQPEHDDKSVRDINIHDPNMEICHGLYFILTGNKNGPLLEVKMNIFLNPRSERPYLSYAYRTDLNGKYVEHETKMYRKGNDGNQ